MQFHRRERLGILEGKEEYRPVILFDVPRRRREEKACLSSATGQEKGLRDRSDTTHFDFLDQLALSNPFRLFENVDNQRFSLVVRVKIQLQVSFDVDRTVFRCAVLFVTVRNENLGLIEQEKRSR